MGVFIRFDGKGQRLSQVGEGMGFLLTDFVQNVVEYGYETKGSDPLNLCAHALDGHRADGLRSAVIQGPSVSRHSGTDG